MRKIIPIREETGAHAEPALDDMLSDSIVQDVMRADGVDAAELQAMLSRIAAELDMRQPPAMLGSSGVGSRSFVFIPHGYPGNCPNVGY
jgi:hypothetical protein